MAGEFEFHAHSWKHVSHEAKDFIRKLMCTDPLARLTCTEALDHPWLTGSRSHAGHHQHQQQQHHRQGEPQKQQKKDILGKKARAWLRQGLNFGIIGLLYLFGVSFIFDLDLWLLPKELSLFSNMLNILS